MLRSLTYASTTPLVCLKHWYEREQPCRKCGELTGQNNKAYHWCCRKCHGQYCCDRCGLPARSASDAATCRACGARSVTRTGKSPSVSDVRVPNERTCVCTATALLVPALGGFHVPTPIARGKYWCVMIARSPWSHLMVPTPSNAGSVGTHRGSFAFPAAPRQPKAQNPSCIAVRRASMSVTNVVRL